MADKFECDQCGGLFDITDKAGRMTLEEIRWNGGIQFPPVKLATHDLCRGCMAVARSPRLKRAHKAPMREPAKQLNEPSPPVIDIPPIKPEEG